MSSDRRDSGASQSSLISYHSVENDPSPEESEHRPSPHLRDVSTDDSEFPTLHSGSHRVHFGSDLRYEYGNPETTETDDDGPRPSIESGDNSSPGGNGHGHGSVDITEEPRGTSSSPEYGGYYSSPGVGGKPETSAVSRRQEQQQKVISTGPSTYPGASFVDRVNSLRHRTKDRLRRIATKLGRPPAEDNDLQPSYDPTMNDIRITHSGLGDAMGSRRGKRRGSGEGQEEGDRGDDEKRPDRQDSFSSEAHRLVRQMTRDKRSRGRLSASRPFVENQPEYSGGDLALDPRLRHSGSTGDGNGGGVLAQLLKLNAALESHRRTSSQSQSASESATPGATTPRKMKWYKKQRHSNTSTSTLVPNLGGSYSGASTPVSSEVLTAASKRRSKQRKASMPLEDEIQITLQIAQIIARQRYIMQLCKALMLFGAPTHRLEEYMQMTAKVIEVDSQFLYVPGCMIMSFDDPSTRTAEVKLVRVGQGIDLGRLADTHNIYKNVVHDVIGIEEAIQELEDIMNKKPRFNKWIIVLVYGLATAMVGPFAFNARPIDLPIIFCNGCLLGIMQHVLAPRSVLYSNVFEVSAAVLTSFIARALGSITADINGNTDYLFCFSAIAQSSIALILPGYTVLCSSLELQSHQIVAGSIRMVYAIIYSLFLGFGITVGTTIYGLIDENAISSTVCPRPGAFGNPYVQRFPFVVAFAACLMVVNQGRWRQTPMMVTIALTGYVTNYFVTRRLGSNSQVANTVAAFAIGVMGNLYSRLWHGHAATAILPGIFVLVPSGLAASGSLIAGVQSADETRSNVSSSSNGSNRTGGGDEQPKINFDVSSQLLGFGMVQVAIAITIGLFVAALVVYPFGKRRSGLFSF